MKTNDVIQLTGLSKQTLYFYENEKLIYVKRDQSDYRDYDIDCVHQLLMIKVLRNLDFSIDDIKLILSGDLEFPESLKNQKKFIQQQIESLSKKEKVIDAIDAKNIPLIPALSTLDDNEHKQYFGYMKSSKNISLGRRLSKSFLLRHLFYLGLNTTFIVCAISIGTYKLTQKHVEGWIMLMIGLMISVVAIGLFAKGMIPLASSFNLNNPFNFLEFNERGILFYQNKNILGNLDYIFKALRHKEQEAMTEVTYSQIEKVTVSKTLRYIRPQGLKIATAVIYPCFNFVIDGSQHSFIAPLVLDGDGPWIAEVILAKISVIHDPEHILDLMKKHVNLSEHFIDCARL